MKRIGILHLTDLHFGSSNEDRSVGEARDTAVSPGLRAEVTYRTSMECFYGRALDLIDGRPVHLIACTGDLGYKYAAESIEAGGSYLSRLAQRLRVRPGRVLVCPGNHDVDRDADFGQELQRFRAVCSMYGFKYPNVQRPACLKIQGLPIIGLNTCLGGTEHALHDLPEELWRTIRGLISEVERSATGMEAVPDILKEQMAAMDIPAVGHTQLDMATRYLAKARGNTVLVLGHHSMLPTRAVDVRPYGQMIDAGIAMFHFMERKRRVIFMHGHGHCENALQANAPNDDAGGFIVALGGTGFQGDRNTAATYLQLLLSDNIEFLAASVFPFVQTGSDYRSATGYRILNPPHVDLYTELDLSALEPGHAIPFSVCAHKLGVPADDTLAESLLRTLSKRQVQLSSIELLSTEEWQVTRL